MVPAESEIRCIQEYIRKDRYSIIGEVSQEPSILRLEEGEFELRFLLDFISHGLGD